MVRSPNGRGDAVAARRAVPVQHGPGRRGHRGAGKRRHQHHRPGRHRPLPGRAAGRGRPDRAGALGRLRRSRRRVLRDGHLPLRSPIRRRRWRRCLAGDIDVYPNIGAPEALARFEGDSRFAVMVGTTEGETVMSANWRREPFQRSAGPPGDHARDRPAGPDRRAPCSASAPRSAAIFAPHNPAYVDLTGLYPHDPDRGAGAAGRGGLSGWVRGDPSCCRRPPNARRGGELDPGPAGPGRHRDRA